MAPPPWMDSRKAPLNPCSLEAIPEPVELPDGSRVWPLMVSCYQLEENGSRRGQMDLHLVEVPDIAGSMSASLPLHFGEPRSVLTPQDSSGILDGKWSSLPSMNNPDNNSSGQSWCFASAHSTGEIRIHSFEVPPSTGPLRLESDPLYTCRYLGESDPPEHSTNTPPPLCLSLNWNSGAAYKQESLHRENTQIVSTYSNGKVAIHDVAFLSEGVQIIQRECWDAHNMFTSPAEVWSACFQGRNTVLSCGDEGNLKLWDTRATFRPVQVLKIFEAGVTCVSPHPKLHNLVACGSYDETISLFDIRYVDPNKKNSFFHAKKKLGGGIWRIKWHPYRNNRMLVGAMHGGCRVLNVLGMQALSTHEIKPTESSIYSYEGPESVMNVKVTKKFTEHESMAYGADWLVCRHPTREGYFEAAGSCSFYDRAVFLWDTVF